MLVRPVLVLMALLAVSGTSSAATITYVFAGTCTANCYELGLTDGDAVTGSITFLESDLIAGDPYPTPVSFSFDFGTVHIDDGDTVELGLFDYPTPAFPTLPDPAIVPSDVTSFAALLHIGLSGSAPIPVLSISPDGSWYGTADGGCLSTDCSFLTTRGLFAEGSGTWSTVQAVPEPATVGLLTTGLVGFTARRRRGRSHSRRPA